MGSPPEYALLAHSVEHFHGKEEVVGSIPTEGSQLRRRSSVGESIRLIIGRSPVRIRSPLQTDEKAEHWELRQR